MNNRLLVGLAVLSAAVVSAHTQPFTFIGPVGTGDRADGGVLQWTDGVDPLNKVSLGFKARRTAFAPWEELRVAEANALAITPTDIPMADVANTYTWDTSAVEPGCYQPIAVLTESTEGKTRFHGLGQLVIDEPGGNKSPSIWITDDSEESTALVDGMWTVRFETDDPDDGAVVTVWLVSAATKEAVRSVEVPVSPGHAVSSAVIDTAGLPSGLYAAHAIMLSPNQRSCDSWTRGLVQVESMVVDAGASAGPGGRPAGCGCASLVDAGGIFLLFAVFARRFRARQ